MHILCLDSTGDLPEQQLQLECAAFYNPEDVMYNITVMWNLTNLHPLVVEVLHAHYYTVVGQELKIPLEFPMQYKRQFIMSQVALNFIESVIFLIVRHKKLFGYMYIATRCLKIQKCNSCTNKMFAGECD